MRIVHILKGKANPDTLNGVNKVVHWMATCQTRQGHAVEVWGLAESMTPPSHPREYRLRLFPLARLRLTLGREVKDALARLEPGAWVQFHSVFIPEFPAISRLLKRRGMAYGVTPHSGYAAGVLAKNPWKKRVYIALREAEYLRNAAWIQAIGASEIEDILRLAPRARVVLIPNGQEPLSLRLSGAPVPAERPVIGYCGRLATQHKGLDFLLGGFASHKARGGAGELWLIGEGEDRARLERQAAENGAATWARFFGARHGEEKFALLANIDVFIHSSRWEGLPMACLEAAAIGKPLLVSRETNLAEYVERSGAGLVLDETSAAGVERALDSIQRLYECGQLQQMGQKARSLIEKEFSWERNARSFVAAIEAASSAV
jgi:glycosyltransferase involved in cell wall biosynthesis